MLKKTVVLVLTSSLMTSAAQAEPDLTLDTSRAETFWSQRHNRRHLGQVEESVSNALPLISIESLRDQNSIRHPPLD